VREKMVFELDIICNSLEFSFGISGKVDGKL
jgi:hypothetical protein